MFWLQYAKHLCHVADRVVHCATSVKDGSQYQTLLRNVIDYFNQEYLKGRTPNPCIACNRYVKWESLLQRSMAIGADYIATGHYARIRQLDNGRFTICNS